MGTIRNIGMELYQLAKWDIFSDDDDEAKTHEPVSLNSIEAKFHHVAVSKIIEPRVVPEIVSLA